MEEYGPITAEHKSVPLRSMGVGESFRVEGDEGVYFSIDTVKGDSEINVRWLGEDGIMGHGVFSDQKPVIPVELVKLTWRDKA